MKKFLIWILSALLLLPSVSTAAISFSSSGVNNGTTSTTVSSLTVTAGQLITVVADIIYVSSQTPAAGDLTNDAGSATIGTPTLDKFVVINTGNAPYFLCLAYYSVLVTGSGSLALKVTPSGASGAVTAHVSIWNGSWDASRVESVPTIASNATDNQSTHASASATSAGAALFLAGLSILQTTNAALTQDAAFTLLTEFENGTTGATGSASYELVGTGTTDDSTYTSTGANLGWESGLLVYKEASAAAATLTSATPSGTLGTSTTATIGATTDTSSGTFYGVVDTAGNISGITAAQIKAAHNNANASPVASCNASVSTTSPSCGVTGLTASTGYSYAVVQNSAGGDSNVLTGTFTTAAAGGSTVPLKMMQMSKAANDDHYDTRLVANISR